MMNPEIKAKWVAALRSGQYEQTKGQLRSEQGFCCLGVLCDLHSKDFNGRWGSEHDMSETRYLGERSVLPYEVVAWADLDDEFGGGVEIIGDENSLDAHNDAGRTFAQIADAIEEQL